MLLLAIQLRKGILNARFAYFLEIFITYMIFIYLLFVKRKRTVRMEIVDH